MAELPAAIDALDKELKRDEEVSGHPLPDHTKIALLVRLFPEKDEKELKHRWTKRISNGLGRTSLRWLWPSGSRFSAEASKPWKWIHWATT